MQSAGHVTRVICAETCKQLDFRAAYFLCDMSAIFIAINRHLYLEIHREHVQGPRQHTGSLLQSDVAYLIVDLSAFCLTASSMKVVAAVWLCLSRIWSTCLSSGWSVNHKDTAWGCHSAAINMQPLIRSGLIGRKRWRMLRSILVLCRLTRRMEINDDLHVNGAPQLHQPGWRGGGGALCLFAWWTFHFLNDSAIEKRLQKLDNTCSVKTSRADVTEQELQLLHGEAKSAVILHNFFLLLKPKDRSYAENCCVQRPAERFKRTIGCVSIISFD